MKPSCQLQSPIRLARVVRPACLVQVVSRKVSFSAAIRCIRLESIPGIFGLIVFLLGTLTAYAQTSMSEYQLKALFLCNFAKYVDWPVEALSGATKPLVIGIMGEDNFNGDLKRTIEGKTVNGREIIIKHIAAGADASDCPILFISSSENSRLSEILEKTSTLPILTVGEDASFLQKGGIINFTLKEGKIRLEINLKLAQKVKLQISSKLLNVAAVVKE